MALQDCSTFSIAWQWLCLSLVAVVVVSVFGTGCVCVCPWLQLCLCLSLAAIIFVFVFVKGFEELHGSGCADCRLVSCQEIVGNNGFIGSSLKSLKSLKRAEL